MFTSSTSNAAQSRSNSTHRYSSTIRGQIAQFFNLRNESNAVFLNEIVGGISMYLCSVYMLQAGPEAQTNCIVNNGTMLNTTQPFMEQLSSSYAAVMGVSTIIFGIGSNAPYVMGPGIPFGRSFACMSRTVGVSSTLAADFVVGWLIFSLVLVSKRVRILQSIPEDFRLGLGAGIGALLSAIAFSSIGDKTAVIVAVHPLDVVHNPTVIAENSFVPLVGFILVIAFFAHDNMRRLSIMGSVLITAFIVWMIKLSQNAKEYKALGTLTIPSSPQTWTPTFMWPYEQSPGMFKYIVMTVIEKVFNVLSVVTSLILLQVCHRIGYKRETFVEILNDSTKISRIYMADAFCNIFVAPFLGTAIVTPFVESTASLIVGARSGLASVVCGLLFLITIPIASSTSMVLGFSTAASTIAFVCFFIVQQVRFISYKHVVDFAPAYLVFFMVPIFGIGFGATASYLCMFIALIITGRFTSIEPAMVVMASWSAMYVILLFDENTNTNTSMTYTATTFGVCGFIGIVSSSLLYWYRNHQLNDKNSSNNNNRRPTPPTTTINTMGGGGGEGGGGGGSGIASMMMSGNGIMSQLPPLARAPSTSNNNNTNNMSTINDTAPRTTGYRSYFSSSRASSILTGNLRNTISLNHSDSHNNNNSLSQHDTRKTPPNTMQQGTQQQQQRPGFFVQSSSGFSTTFTDSIPLSGGSYENDMTPFAANRAPSNGGIFGLDPLNRSPSPPLPPPPPPALRPSLNQKTNSGVKLSPISPIVITNMITPTNTTDGSNNNATTTALNTTTVSNTSSATTTTNTTPPTTVLVSDNPSSTVPSSTVINNNSTTTPGQPSAQDLAII
jgi:AGZA family xanthine/uracil permease-like MFS transporter